MVRAGRLQYGEIPDLEKQLSFDADATEVSLSRFLPSADRCHQQIDPDRLISDAVTASDIAAVVSRATGIPVHDMVRGEKQKLLQLEGVHLIGALNVEPHVDQYLQRKYPSGLSVRIEPCALWPMQYVLTDTS